MAAHQNIEPDTQERINDDVYKISDVCTYFSSDGSCAKCKFVSQYGDADSAYEECPKIMELEQMAILDLLRRQRELDARTMGGGDTFKRNRKCVWSVDDDGSGIPDVEIKLSGMTMVSTLRITRGAEGRW